MKRYILKKELPTFKVGEKFELSRSGNLIQRNKGDFGDLVVYHRETLKKFPNVLKEWFEEMPEKPETVWDLMDGDKYYSISSDGFITTEKYCLGTQYDDDRRVALGNAFLTREDAEKEIALREAREILKKDTKGFQPDWDNNNEPKYEVYYNYNNECLYTCCYEYCCAHQDLWFATAEDAEASIKAHPNEWKTYLGVEE